MLMVGLEAAPAVFSKKKFDKKFWINFITAVVFMRTMIVHTLLAETDSQTIINKLINLSPEIYFTRPG